MVSPYLWLWGALAIASPSTVERTSPPIGVVTPGCVGFFPLRASHSGLTERIRAGLVAAGLSEAIEADHLAVSVADLTKNRLRYAGINDDVMLYAASLPKIVALLAFADRAGKGELPWSEAIEARLWRMINRSSNVEASWAFDQVGLDALEAIVTRPRYCFYGTRYGGLWLGRPFRPGGPVRRDPRFNISHGATARQVARFYVLLDRGLFDGPSVNERVRRVMGPPAIEHKFVKALRDRRVDIPARKSGSWRRYHADSALIEHAGRRYVLVALAEMRAGGQAVERVARVVDDVLMSTP